MYKRYVTLLGLLFIVLLLTPQLAQTIAQDEGIKERVRPSIERGVAYLLSLQGADGTWPWPKEGMGNINRPETIGATALAAVTLMECGVSPKDRQVQAAVKVIRNAIANPAFKWNYAMCMSLILLDRYHRESGTKHSDRGNILSLAERIARGQAHDGGWGYDNPNGGPTDNSNTQFAVVALWVARKYLDKPSSLLDQALGRAEQRFRKAQQPDGGWGYDSPELTAVGGNKSSGSMTCAGVLGLALHAGAKRQAQQADLKGAGGTSSSGDVFRMLETDTAVAKARLFILNSLHEHIAGTLKDLNGTTHEAYFFWSLERVATLYKWRKIEGVDWFDLGATHLMKKQNRNGGWSTGLGPVPDTCLILLFLAKSNLLGPLQTVDFDGKESLGGGPLIPKKMAPDTKPKDNEAIAKELLQKLLTALPPQQADILADLAEGKGNEYTNALVDAISLLNSNAAKEQARNALAGRFQKKTITTLFQYMEQPNRELRLAAAVAARLKNDISASPKLIPLLADQDAVVSTAALDALKTLSNQDFGKSVDRWSRWWDTLPSKPKP